MLGVGGAKSWSCEDEHPPGVLRPAPQRQEKGMGLLLREEGAVPEGQ